MGFGRQPGQGAATSGVDCCPRLGGRPSGPRRFLAGPPPASTGRSRISGSLELKLARVEPYFEMAEFYEKRGEAGEVEGALKAASLMQPLDPRLDYYRGVARVLDGGPFSEAEQFLKNYLSRAPVRSDFPSYAAAHEWLGRLYERSGRTRQAVEHYQMALRLDAHRREARQALARLHPDR